MSRREAWDGLVVPIEVPHSQPVSAVRRPRRHLERAVRECHGTGARLEAHCVRVTLPPGVADGARIRFRVSSQGADSVRVEIRIEDHESGN